MPATSVSAGEGAGPANPARALLLLSAYGGLTAFVTSAMAVHLPALVAAAGATLAQALLAGVLLGPAQVAARLGEYVIAQRHSLHPLITARVATALHPIACVVLGALSGVFGAYAAAGLCFAVLHGAGNGMISVAKGVLPLAIFGPAGYGSVTGKIAVAGRLTQAFAPLVFGVVLENGGAGWALGLSAALGLASLLMLAGLGRGR